ncbi:ligand-gated channel protein [Brenneria goodwinii]|uniref:ligand-gated channel protein n=1 Tax=Brenneria goodwinii TaxID=1109412 RepID=UPI0036E458DF
MSISIRKSVALALAATASTSVFGATQQDVMVVTASGYEQKIEDSAASISVISREQLETKAYRDVTDALKDVPGVVVTGGASSSDISIRGMSSKYTLILVDGKRVDTRGTRPNSDNSGIEQGWLPPIAAIERIEVVRGPMSSLYGSDAMGGVINVITRKTHSEWTTSVRGDATIQEDRDSGDIYQSSIYAAGPLIDGLLGVQINGLLSHRSEDKIVNGYNEQRMRNGGVTFTLTPDEKNTLDFDLSHSVQDRNVTPGKSIETSDTESDVRYERNNYAITHSGIYDFGMTTSYIQREENRNPHREMKLDNTIFNTQTSFYLGDHTLSLGGQYRYESLNDKGNQLSTAQDLEKLTRKSWALFAEDEWQMTNDFALTTGLRMDSDENYGSHWTPRAYGVWHLTEQWTLKGGVSAGYRSPDLRHTVKNWGQATGGRAGNAIILGNPDLKPEKSLSQEVGIIWDNREGVNFGLTLFNTDYKDKITEARECETPTGQTAACPYDGHDYRFISNRINVDKATMRGVESTFNWDITDDLSLASSYTYTHSEQKSGEFKGKPLNQMPKHMFNSTLNWKATEDLGAWARVNYRGKTSEYLGRTSMSSPTPSYTFVDLGATYQVTKDVQLLGGVYNVLDKRVDYETYDTVLDGRRYNVGVNVTF